VLQAKACPPSLKGRFSKTLLFLPQHSAVVCFVFIFKHCPMHRSRVRNQSGELISLQSRFALLLKMFLKDQNPTLRGLV